MNKKEIYQKHILDLEIALADNATSVEFEGRKVTLDSAEATIKRIQYFKTQLSNLNRRGPKRTAVVTLTKKGL